ncbi:MAG TPA: hypothetical protein VGK82_16215 [Pyrinomonadaceae bacterium]
MSAIKPDMTGTPEAVIKTYQLLDLNAAQLELINHVAVLARKNFAPRAAGYD